MDLEPIMELVERECDPEGEHWAGCHVEHIECAADVLLVEVARWRGGFR